MSTQTNPVIDALKARRSCRSFSSESVPQELIDQIIDAGLYAPSGMGRQAVKILAITDKKVRDQLAAHSLGLGSIWIHRAKEEFEMDAYKELLKEVGIDCPVEGIGHCAIGYVKGEIPAPAARKENRVFYK